MEVNHKTNHSRKKIKQEKGNRSGRDSKVELPAERREELESRDSMKATFFLGSVQRSKTKEMIFGTQQHEKRWNNEQVGREFNK